MKPEITFTIDHDSGDNRAMLTGDFKNQRFVEIFRVNSWFDWSLRLAKFRIERKFKIVYGQIL